MLLPVMVDTGAERSCISKEKAKELLHKMGNENKTIMSFIRKPDQLRAANGTYMESPGLVKMQFNFAGTEYTWQFQIVAGLSHPVILGYDFMQKHIVNMNNIKKTFMLDDGSVIPYFIGKDIEPSQSYVHIVGKHIIPPATAKLIPIAARKHITSARITAVFVPKQANSRLKPMGLELVTMDNRTTHILYENHTQKSIHLDSMSIGTILEVHDTQIMTIQNHAQKVKNDTEKHAKDSQNTNNAQQNTNKSTETSANTNTQGKLPPGFVVLDTLTKEQQEQVIQLVTKYSSAFVQHENDHGLTDKIEHTIELNDTTPLYIRQFPLDLKKAKAVDDWVDNLIALDKAEESISPWNTPVFVVPKPKGNGWRIVNDFRQLNARTKRMEWPIPHVQHAIDSLGGASYFTQIDLSDAFFQVPLKPEHREYTAFNTGTRHIQYKVMPMGLCNSTATFQRLMSQIFRDTPWLRPYVDDLIIPASSFEELIERTEFVFNRLKEAGLKMSGKKTAIGLSLITYLGTICSREGIRMDPNKIDTVQKWPRPTTVTQLRQFLGLCSHLRRFIKNYARIAGPLTKQQGGPKDAKVNWTTECIHAFQKLKDALSDPLQCLAYPDFSENAEPFIVETDACKMSEGAVLKQVQNGVERVIAYASRSFTPTERAWPVTQLEAHAIFWAITKQFHYYLKSSSKPFIVRTDHKPALAMQVRKVAAERMYRWALELQSYDMEMYHISGAKHVMSDAISRLGYLRELYESLEAEAHINSIHMYKVRAIRDQHNARSHKYIDAKRTLKNNKFPQTKNHNTASDTNNQHTHSNNIKRPSISHIQTQNASTHTPNSTINNICTEDSTKIFQGGCTHETFNITIESNQINTITDAQQTQSTNSVFVEMLLPHLENETDNIQTENIPHISALSGAGYQHEAIKKAQQEDESTSHLYSFLKHKTKPPKAQRNSVKRLARKCYLLDDVIYRNGGIYHQQLLVPQVLREQLLVAMHDAPSAGHFGVFSTLNRLTRRYWWPGISGEVFKYVQSCKECQQRNFSPNMKTRQPILKEVPQIFERVSIDIQGEFTPSKKGNRWIVTFMDIHSRWIEGFPVSDISALTIAKLLVEQIILRYGPIRSLLSDRGSNFLSDIIRETCRIFQIQKLNIAAYHPESNAHVERIHRVYSDSISKHINPKHDDWDEIFPFIQWAYRSNVQSTLQTSPYELVYGREVQAFVDIAMLPPPPEKVSADVKQWRHTLLKRLEKSRKAATEMTKQAMERLLTQSSTKPPRTFEIGQEVMIRNQTNTIDPNIRLTHKWEPRFIGPYIVKAKVGDITYHVVNPADATDNKRHVSVDDMKPMYNRILNKPTNLDLLKSLPITGDSHDFNRIDEDEREIEKILDHRTWSRAGKRNEHEYLVRFKHLPWTHDEWIHESELRAPDLLAEYLQNASATFAHTRHYKTTRSGAVKRPMNSEELSQVSKTTKKTK